MTADRHIRLFVDAHVFDGEYQGSRSFIKELYTELAAVPGLRIFMAAFDTLHLQKEFAALPNITFIKYNTKSSVKRLLFQVPAIIKKYRIHYAHFQYIIPLQKKCRYIVTTHDVLFKDEPGYFPAGYRYLKTFLYKFAVKRADILTTVSEFSKQSITRHFSIPAKKIHVIPHGVAARFFAPFDKTAAREQVIRTHGIQHFILYVSRFEPRKNQYLLLKVFAELELYKKNYCLVFAGHRSLPVKDFDEGYAALPDAVQKSVFVFPHLDDEQLLSFYRAAACFVYPSSAEGFGMPPLEAAAAGVPVLCSNRTALADFEFFGKNHLDISNTAAFKERLAAILEHEDSLHTENIKAYVQQHYSWQNAAAAFYKLVKQHSDDHKF